MRRKLTFAALTIALFLAGFAVASFPALAELRTITVTLVGGQQIVTTVDVPPGPPTSPLKLPEIPAPIAGIHDGTKTGSNSKSNGATGSTGSTGSTGATGNTGTSGPQNNRPRRRSRNSPGKFLGETNAQPAVQPTKRSPRNRQPDGSPTNTATTLTLALPGPAPI